MPFKMSNYLETKILDLLLEQSTWAAPTQCYLGLFTAFTESADGNTYTEVGTSGTAYARQALTFDPPSGGVTQNTSLFDFPMATSSWGNITYYGIFDALSGGNLLYWGLVTNPTVIGTGEQFEVGIAGLQVTISGNITIALANAVLDHTLRGNAYTAPASVWVALLTAFTDDFTYTENTDANYVRKQGIFAVPSNSVTSVANTTDVSYSAAAANYTVTHVAIFDDSAAGNMMLRGPLSPSKSITTGKVFKFPIGQLVVTAD